MDSMERPESLDREAIVAELLAIIADMASPGDDELAATLGEETRLGADLGFASFDLVQLVGYVETHYRRPNLPFQKLLVTPDGSYVADLRVSELVDFLHAQLNLAGTDATPPRVVAKETR
jgi:hypothetical protein